VATYHIETAAELRKEWFRGVKRVGITAGASTPEWIIEEVKKHCDVSEEEEKLLLSVERPIVILRRKEN
jgi:4-hydroxy-3-methylbut-2-enyl diphosphate reductase